MKTKFDIPIVNVKSSTIKSFLDTISGSAKSRTDAIDKSVAAIIDNVRKNGDGALFEYIKKFDGADVTPSNIRVKQTLVKAQAKKCPADLRKSIDEAAKRIEAYHLKQKRTGFKIKTAEGVLEQRIVPLQRVAVYIPGGHAVYFSTVLMNVIPAQIAGVKQIVAVTPPRQELDPAIAYILDKYNVSEIYRMGGAHAVAALAYGTKTILAVDKITGPGNAYVATAKKMVYGAVAIDMIAGPSEVAIMADESSDPTHVALDLLAQAEHGSGDELVICVTESRDVAEIIKSALLTEIAQSPRIDIFKQLSSMSIILCVTPGRKISIDLINALAPEHLQIMTDSARTDADSVYGAAAIFIGPNTPVALGDYFIGTNHVLPTGRAARYASPLGVDDFVKRISVAEVTMAGLKKSAAHVSRLARAEGFVHHALSGERRID